VKRPRDRTDCEEGTRRVSKKETIAELGGIHRFTTDGSRCGTRSKRLNLLKKKKKSRKERCTQGVRTSSEISSSSSRFRAPGRSEESKKEKEKSVTEKKNDQKMAC